MRARRSASAVAASLLAAATILSSTPADAYYKTGASKAQDPTMEAVGITMTALGIVSLLVGAILVGAGSSGNSRDDAGFTGAGLPMQLTGAVMLPTGVILAGIGIPLWAVGGAEPDEEETEQARQPVPASARVMLAGGGLRLEARW